MFQILEMAEVKVGEENKSLPQLKLSYSNDMDPNKYFSGYNLEDARRKQKFDMLKRAIWTGNFYFNTIWTGLFANLTRLGGGGMAPF